MAGRSLNKAILLGHAGKDAELRYTNNGKAVATFSVATSESWRDASGTTQDRTTWHNVVAWDKLAEVCGNYVKKGKQLYIEGRIQNRSYDDKDGNKRYVSEIVITDMILLGGSGERGGSSNGGGYSNHQSSTGPESQVQPPQPEFDQVPDSDLPF
jgi:single-strand DNA-binding protein